MTAAGRLTAGLTVSTCVAALVFARGVRARFAVDGTSTASSTAVATVEARAPGYSWLRVRFYAAPLSGADAAAAARGDDGSIRARWIAAMQLTIDAHSAVTQVDLSLPGHTCTIAGTPDEIAASVQQFDFDGRRVRLVAKGPHRCDMKFMGVPDQAFEWDVDLDTQVRTNDER